jgi:hypothetical protein
MSIERWRGLKDLLCSAVENGSSAIERVQKETARRPFQILELIPPLTIPVRGIHEIHDTAVSSVHETIRLTTRVVSQTLDLALDGLGKLTPGTEAADEPQREQ